MMWERGSGAGKRGCAEAFRADLRLNNYDIFDLDNNVHLVRHHPSCFVYYYRRWCFLLCLLWAYLC